MIKNLRDLSCGTICETRDHGFYTVIADGAGRTAMFNERGTWGRIDTTTNMWFDDGKKEVVRVYGFTQTLPLLDQISEAIKFIYETKPNTKDLLKLWESESEEVTEIKREIAALQADKNAINGALAQLTTRLITA